MSPLRPGDIAARPQDGEDPTELERMVPWFGRVLSRRVRRWATGLDELPKIYTSHFGVIPKGTIGKWRLILDMSSPKGASVNDGIEEFLCSLSYVGIKTQPGIS